MPTPVIMPKLGLNMTEGVLVEWLVEDGATVQKGQPLFAAETDKVLTEVLAEADGVLRRTMEAGSTIPVAGVVGYILQDGEVIPSADGPAPAEARMMSAAIPTRADLPPHKRLASPAARRRARELNVDIERVTTGGKDGVITVTDVEAFAAAVSRPPDPPEAHASPVAQRLARATGVDLSSVRGTGPGGRITKEDVERAARAAPQVAADAGRGQSSPLTRVRALIAERMLVSSQQTARVTLTAEADATEIHRLRADHNELATRKGAAPLSYDAILVKLLATALVEFPYMNARLDGDRIVLWPEIGIGVALDTPRGLLVPVVRQPDRKSMVEIGAELQAVNARALEGRSLPGDLEGGTFTLTNLGMYGVDAFTPIIDLPQAAILGVGCIARRPAEYRGELCLRYRTTLSLTFDHRLIDGAPAARFLQRLSELVEAPAQLAVTRA